MKTLIELYDERAIENVIGPETFRPERVIYLCPHEVAQSKQIRGILVNYFKYRGVPLHVEYIECDIYDVNHIVDQLWSIYRKYSDCALDVTGGTETALFAAGMFCRESEIPTFTYSRKQNTFYNICHADFADRKTCTLEYKVEDFFRMTGGFLREGRVDNHILGNYMDKFDRFFSVFLKYRKNWADDITFFQRISRADTEEDVPMDVSGSFYQKGEHGKRVGANVPLLHDLEDLCFIRDVRVKEKSEVSFSFANIWTRFWLRDVGSVLELYMYKACIDANIFEDVISSAVVDWDGSVGHDSVSNEIDVVASRGCVPIFISCKACEIKTYAINELSILRDRFGGKGAKAVLVTSEKCNAAARHRCAQLGITVIDQEELVAGRIMDRLRIIMKVR